MDNLEIKVSVIIPIFNTENYVRQCVESVLTQTLDSVEIILVDDGSTDNSIYKIKDLVSKNNNIKLLTQENSGVSAARNAGLRAAHGKYVTFLDSDDFFKKDFLRSMYDLAEKYQLDIAVSDALLQKENSYSDYHTPHTEPKVLFTGMEFIKKSYQSGGYHGVVTCKLFKKELFTHNNITFHEGIIHEDEEITAYLFLKSQRVKSIRDRNYVVNFVEGSITRSVNDKSHNLYHIQSFEKILNRYLDMKATMDIGLQKEFCFCLMIISNTYIGWCLQLGELDKIDKKLLGRIRGQMKMSGYYAYSFLLRYY